VLGKGKRSVQLDVGEVGQPDQRRQVLGQNVGHLPDRAVCTHSDDARGLLLVEVRLLDAVG